MNIDKITELVKTIITLFAALSPLLIGAYFGFRDKFQKKKIELMKKQEAENQEAFFKDKEQRREAYKAWEHEESQRVISKIKILCNYYKDQSSADLVSYGQLENGSVATSKLCNMFITCLAEDDRFGKLGKGIMNQQRIPYSRVSSWIDAVRDHVFGINDMNSKDVVKDDSLRDIFLLKGTHSMLSESIKDGSGYFIGFVVFEYAENNYNNCDIKEQKQSLHDFKSAVQSVFINYHIAREEKMQEFKLTMTDIN